MLNDFTRYARGLYGNNRPRYYRNNVGGAESNSEELEGTGRNWEELGGTEKNGEELRHHSPLYESHMQAEGRARGLCARLVRKGLCVALCAALCAAQGWGFF